MLGLSETKEEVIEIMQRSRDASVDIFTLGQYMQPTRGHLPVTRYVSPEEFSDFQKLGSEMGFKATYSGPLVRSSYNAEQVAQEVL